MRSKILDQFKYQGSAGTAFDRTGFDSGLFIAIGGTSNTAIKVQHCDTNNGTFADFATLVSADDAGSGTDVGIALDISGAKKFLKMTGATKASCVLSDAKKEPCA